jgi:hypothetical protein
MSKSSVNKIDQIKGLIFGEEINNIESKFDHLKEEIDSIFENLSLGLQNLEKLTDEENQKLNSKIEKSNIGFNKKAKSMQEKHHAEIIRLKERLSGAIDLKEKSLSTKISESIKKLSDKLTAQEERYKAELHEIKRNYISKAEFSDILLEISLRYSDFPSENTKKNKQNKSLKEANA